MFECCVPCVCMSVYVCVPVCMHVCGCMYMHVCVYVGMRMCVHVLTDILLLLAAYTGYTHACVHNCQYS